MTKASTNLDRNIASAAQLELLVRMIDDAFQGPSWHGPALRGCLRGVSVATAAWRPDSTRHNIWEQVLHAAYWKYTVRRRLLDEKRGSFPLKGSNWFSRDDVRDEAAWRASLELLEDTHAGLRRAIEQMPARTLPDPVGGRGKLSHEQLIRGVALHDIYHAGQIQLLKRLATAAEAD